MERLNIMTNRSKITLIRVRPKWKRLAMWPRNFWRCFRIQGVMTVPQRLHISIMMANAISRH